MSLFRKSTVKEQLLDQYSELLPNKDKVTQLKKQLTSIEHTREQIIEKWNTLKEEAEAAMNEDNSIQTKGVGFEGFVKNVESYFKQRKKQRDPEDILLETEATAKFEHDFMTAKLTEMKAEISVLSEQQLAKIRDIEQSFETSRNTSEVDTVVSDLTKDVNSLIERYNYLCSRKDLSESTADKTAAISTSTLEGIQRESLEYKQANAAEKAQGALIGHLRDQQAVDERMKVLGREPASSVGEFDRL